MSLDRKSVAIGLRDHAENSRELQEDIEKEP